MYRFKLKEIEVGDTEINRGKKTTVSAIDDETGAIEWDVADVADFSSTYNALKKAKEFNDKLAAVEVGKRKNVIKVAKADRNQEVDTWIKDGVAMAVWQKKQIIFQDEEISRIENYAETLGLDFSDFVRTAALDAITIAVDETDED